ncbi:PAS domain S-box-containing protein [Paraburkholderia sp. BL27I4N3]|uniref:response regulator n=1 Tax=Paraburkholderia sp. BL27I4N3 TaxID=1938805 RepID=UPI000E261C7B|nr:response regulator [Paraburkholderia sp. BL27I4N3]REE23720.1 PAS domain S-box-containing protein [Paraburkholderia sp. BL27I4N3]
MNELNTEAGERPTILIADDTPANFGVVVESLTDRGFRVLVALDGEEALERALFSQPDLILLDVKMPGIDGFETCRRLKADPRTRDIAVIFMTSLTGAEDMVEGFSAGGVDYVAKPVRVNEMMARIETHLALRVMHRQLIAQNRLLLNEIAVRQQAETELSSARDALEQQVEQRTRQLAESNARLSAQIEERRRAEAKLQASEARFRTIVETSPIPLCITSMPEGVILYVNEPLRELFGLDNGMRTLTNIVDFYMDPVDRDRLVSHLRTEGSFNNSEVHMRRVDGSPFWAMATARVATFGDTPAIYVGLNDITSRKRIEQELFESRNQLRELSAYMEAIREEERKRIAMEIHDELGQLLTALKMDVSLLKMRLGQDPDAMRKAEDMRELVERTIWMVRNVANHLRPVALNFGVVSALEWLVEDFIRRHGIPCQLHINGGEPVLPETCATAVFRIVQASLTNVGRHAHATRADVTLTSTASALKLHVSDDGCGFDPYMARTGYSYGLLGMQERARLIGGAMTIDSAPGMGTAISIYIPHTGGAENDRRPDC